ncbi:MAG: hypothetical protein U0003_01725 [Vampirovibrionales bacterium]
MPTPWLKGPRRFQAIRFWTTLVLLIPATSLCNCYGLLWMLAVGLGLEAALWLMTWTQAPSHR